MPSGWVKTGVGVSRDGQAQPLLWLTDNVEERIPQAAALDQLLSSRCSACVFPNQKPEATVVHGLGGDAGGEVLTHIVPLEVPLTVTGLYEPNRMREASKSCWTHLQVRRDPILGWPGRTLQSDVPEELRKNIIFGTSPSVSLVLHAYAPTAFPSPGRRSLPGPELGPVGIRQKDSPTALPSSLGSYLAAPHNTAESRGGWPLHVGRRGRVPRP